MSPETISPQQGYYTPSGVHLATGVFFVPFFCYGGTKAHKYTSGGFIQ